MKLLSSVLNIVQHMLHVLHIFHHITGVDGNCTLSCSARDRYVTVYISASAASALNGCRLQQVQAKPPNMLRVSLKLEVTTSCKESLPDSWHVFRTTDEV